MKNLLFSLIATTMLLTSVGWSAPMKSTLEDEDFGFKYQGKAIDALCLSIDRQNNKEKTVNLAHCGFVAHSEYKPSAQNKNLTRDGFIGTDYTKDGNFAGYAYYRVIGKYKDAYVIQTVSNEGGSGTFRELMLVKRHNANLVLQNLAAGDRCLGGVESAQLRQNKLDYQILITPADMIELSKQNVHGYKAFTDLRGCAACCIGTASFSLNLKDRAQPAKLTKITLDKMPPPAADAAPDVEACFDNAVVAYQKNGKFTLDRQELTKFMDNFNQTCNL